MKNSDLKIFILSHKSPNKCETLDTLRKLGFEGKCYILIDDEDDYVKEYKEKYKDDLIIFNKAKYKEQVDLGYSIKHLPSYSHPLFARNAIEDVAKEMGLEYYILADDDIYDFKVRPLIDEYKKVPNIPVDNIGELLLIYLEYLLSNDIACIGLGTPNFYFGGYDGLKSGKYITRRCVSNFYMRNLKYDVNWIMPMDDFATSVKEGNMGKLFLTLYPLEAIVRPQYTQKNRKEKDNGMEEFYKNSTTLTRHFCTQMVLPGIVKLKYWKTDFVPFLNKESAYPKIISGKYKKG